MKRKINKEKTQLTRAGKPEGDILTLCNCSRVQQKDPFLIRTQPMNSYGLCFNKLPNFLLLSIKVSSFSCHRGIYTHGYSQLQVSHCYSLLILKNKTIFARDISDCLLISGQHHQPAALFKLQKPLPIPSSCLLLAVLLVPILLLLFNVLDFRSKGLSPNFRVIT